MAIPFLVPLFASILQGAIGHGLAENKAAREANANRRMALARREELQPIIDELRGVKDYFDIEEQVVRDFSRASNQLTAQAASTGMTNAGTGGLDAQRADTLGGYLAQLAQQKTQDEFQRKQLLAQILSDPTLYAGMVPEENVLGNTLFGALLGGVAGAGSNLNAYLGSEAGLAALAGAFSQGDNTVNVQDHGSVADAGTLADVFGGGPTGSGAQASPANIAQLLSLITPNKAGMGTLPGVQQQTLLPSLFQNPMGYVAPRGSGSPAASYYQSFSPSLRLGQ